jgi:hypothetical protein
VAVRPFNAGLVAGGCLAFGALRRWRDAFTIGLSSVVTFLLLALVPLALGAALNERVDGSIVGSPEDPVIAGRTMFGFAVSSPLKMLLSPYRGLFVWTPVTLLACIGLIQYFRRRDASPAVAILTSMTGGLLLLHVAVEYWDAGWSFSMRLLAAPVALYAVGAAALLDHRSGIALVVRRSALAAAIAWSLFLGMNHAFGASQDDGAFEIAGKVTSGERSLGDLRELTWSYSRLRHLLEKLP